MTKYVGVLPNISMIRPSLSALTRSDMVNLRSETLNSPQLRVKFKILSRVTPGKMEPSNSGVTNSFSINVVSQHQILALVLGSSITTNTGNDD